MQIDRIQDATNRPWRNRLHDLICDGLPGQIRAGPVRNAKPLGNGLKTGQSDDLGALQGGKAASGDPIAPARSADPRGPPAHTDEPCARPWIHHRPSERPALRQAGRLLTPKGVGHAGLETTATDRSETPAAVPVSPQGRSRRCAASDLSCREATRSRNFLHDLWPGPLAPMPSSKREVASGTSSAGSLLTTALSPPRSDASALG
jgi:hypothetical protein